MPHNGIKINSIYYIGLHSEVRNTNYLKNTTKQDTLNTPLQGLLQHLPDNYIQTLTLY